MKIKNYTTSVPVQQSISEIEQMLVEYKATHIMKEFMGDGRLRGIVFQLNGVAYKLPSNSEKVYKRLYEGKHPKIKANAEAQAERVAWRVIRDWLHAQISLIYIGQAELEQIMLPYAYDGEQSLYERFKARGGAAGLLTYDPNVKQNVKEEETEAEAHD